MTTREPLADWPGPWPEERPRAVQTFTDEYLERCRDLTPAQIARFLEEFRQNYAAAESARAKRKRRARHGGRRDGDIEDLAGNC